MKSQSAIVIPLILIFLTVQVRAELPGFSSPGAPTSPGSEYFVGKVQGKPLITVHLLSGVRAPGVYHIPIQTNLAQLFSYAGGLQEGASVDDISIRNTKFDSKIVTNHYDLYSIIQKNEEFPNLQDNDTIHIAIQKDNVSRVALWVGIFSSIATLALTSIVLDKTISGK